MSKRLTPAERMKEFRYLSKHYLYVDSSQIRKDIEYIVQNRVENLMILGAPYAKYNRCDIDWLESVSDVVKDLVITPTGQETFSFDGLKSCNQLECLTINETMNQIIDLSSNSKLKHLMLSKYNKLIGIEGLTELESLVLTNKTPPRLLVQSVFDGFPNLKSLTLNGVKLIAGLGFLKNSPLDLLTILNCRKPSLKGISNLKLKHFVLERCKNIGEENELFEIDTLQTLKLINSMIVDNVGRFRKLQKLETLVVLGTSYILDGDFDEMKGKLEHFSFDNKKHYKTSFEEFKRCHLLKKVDENL